MAPVAFAAGYTPSQTALTLVPAEATIYCPVALSLSDDPLNFGSLVVLDTHRPCTIALTSGGSYDYKHSSNCLPLQGVKACAPSIAKLNGSRDKGLNVGFSFFSFMGKGSSLKIDTPKTLASGSSTFSVPLYGTLTVPRGVTGKIEGLVFVTACYL